VTTVMLLVKKILSNKKYETVRCRDLTAIYFVAKVRAKSSHIFMQSP
jgi:hypothetical protein